MDAGAEYSGRSESVEGLTSYLQDDTVGVSHYANLILENEIEEDQLRQRSNPFNDPGSNAIHHDVYDFNQHCHQQLQAPHDLTAQRTLMIVSILTLFFIIGEVIGGTLSHSLAILTDAAHMLSDLASFIISLFAVWFSKRPATRRMSFGFHRAEILGAVCSILMIWVLTGILVYMAILRLYYPQKINADFMLGTAAAGVCFNIMCIDGFPCRIGVVLHKGGHGHSHGGGGSHAHSHSHSHASVAPIVRERTVSLNAYPTEDISHINKHTNINIRAASIHVLGDLVQSIGVLIAAIIIKVKPEYTIADPICTFIFCALVLLTTVTVMKDALLVLMESTPSDVDYMEVLTSLEQINGVKAAHSLHMWSLTLDKAALAVHLAVDKHANGVEVMQRASKMMKYKYNLQFTTIQIEPYEPSIMNVCVQCVGPQT